MAIRREFELLLVAIVLFNGQTIFASEMPRSSAEKHVVCDQYLARPTFGILHVTGFMVPDQQKEKLTKGHHHVLHEAPVLMVSTSSSNESTDCQQIVDVDKDGVFQTDVAVNNDFSEWSVVVTACGSQHGKKANRCRMVVVAPPGERDGDDCHPVAFRVAPTGQDRPDKSYYAVMIDFRRCYERRQSSSHKIHMVKNRRTRRQAGTYPDGEDARDLREEKELERLGGMKDHSILQTKRRSYPLPAHSVAPKNRGNPQGAGKLPPASAGYRQWMNGVRSQNWKEANGDPEELELDEEPKRRWEKSGLAWMKKDNQRARIYDGKLAEEGVDSKRRWEKSGMSWMKRRDDEDGKRRWEKSGMSWMKRRRGYDDIDDLNHYNNYADYDPAANEQPAENTKRRWEKSGVSWIKRRK